VGVRVRKHWLVQALLLGVPATTALLAGASVAQATEECHAKPGPTAPVGSRWVYRINRADRRHCWFLSSNAASSHSQLPRRHRALAGDVDAARQSHQPRGELLNTSAPTEETNVAVAAEPPVVPHTVAPSTEQSSENLVPHTVPTIKYLPSSPIAVTASEKAVSVARTPASESKTNVAFLVGAAVVGLLFAAGIFHVTRRIQRTPRVQRFMHGRSGEPVGIRPLSKTTALPMTSNLREDARHELRRDQQRTRKYLLSSDDRRDASAVLLPPAAAWLGRLKDSPTAEPATYELADV
jgi:hypothetical protein